MIFLCNWIICQCERLLHETIIRAVNMWLIIINSILKMKWKKAFSFLFLFVAFCFKTDTYFLIYIGNLPFFAQSAGAVKYTDCTSAKR